MNNPQSYRRVLLLIRGITVVMLVGTLVWAMIPVRSVPIEEFVVDTTKHPEPDSTAKNRVVSSAAFDLTLWHVPPVAQQPRAPEPVRVVQVSFELMAITTRRDEAGQPVGYAVIYDPGEDQLHTMPLGQVISGYTLTEINADSVTLRSGNREVRLELNPDGEV